MLIGIPESSSESSASFCRSPRDVEQGSSTFRWGVSLHGWTWRVRNVASLDYSDTERNLSVPIVFSTAH